MFLFQSTAVTNTASFKKFPSLRQGHRFCLSRGVQSQSLKRNTQIQTLGKGKNLLSVTQFIRKIFFTIQTREHLVSENMAEIA